MNTNRRTQQVASLALAALMTFSVLFALNGLAAPDSAAVTQLVCVASSQRA